MGWAEKANPRSWYNRKRAQRDRAARPADPVTQKDPNVAFEFSFIGLLKKIKEFIWRILPFKKKAKK